jgi:hypothetical protein
MHAIFWTVGALFNPSSIRKSSVRCGAKAANRSLNKTRAVEGFKIIDVPGADQNTKTITSKMKIHTLRR